MLFYHISVVMMMMIEQGYWAYHGIFFVMEQQQCERSRIVHLSSQYLGCHAMS